MKHHVYSQTPKARALLKAWMAFRDGKGDFTKAQAARLFLDVPDRRDWALILRGLPGAKEVIARLSDAMARCDVTENGLLWPRASGQISEKAAFNFAWAMSSLWQAQTERLPANVGVHAGSPLAEERTWPDAFRWFYYDLYTFVPEVCDALRRAGITPPSPVDAIPGRPVPADVIAHLRWAIQSGSEWSISAYILHPMCPGFFDPVPEYELYLGGYEMLAGRGDTLFIAPLDPVYWAKFDPRSVP